MFGATLDYQYNWLAVVVWLGIVVVISILASIFPARGPRGSAYVTAWHMHEVTDMNFLLSI